MLEKMESTAITSASSQPVEAAGGKFGGRILAEKVDWHGQWEVQPAPNNDGAADNARRDECWRRYYLAMISILFFLASWYRLCQSVGYSRPHINNRGSGSSDYVFRYAPLVWLAIDEGFFPSDMAAQISNTEARLDRTTLINPPTPLTIYNLDQLNEFSPDNGTDVYLTSLLDVTKLPSYLSGVRPNEQYRTVDVTSCAIISVQHPTNESIIHVFYMYFYAYNRGPTVLDHELGDHVGDWEHNMIRFVDGQPTHIWYSQHWNGEAFTYDAVEKQNGRPITYSARGSHANYATAGTHDHSIPDVDGRFGLLEDHTSQGLLWDPTLSAYKYTYDPSSDRFEAADVARSSPLGAMRFRGQWGDQEYLGNDPRQKTFFGLRKYVDGPNGPMWKGLDRTGICPDNGFYCIIRSGLGPVSDASEPATL